jgi:hypothetical protein
LTASPALVFLDCRIWDKDNPEPELRPFNPYPVFTPELEPLLEMGTIVNPAADPDVPE